MYVEGFKSRKYHGLSHTDKLLVLSGVPISYIKKGIKAENINFLQTTMHPKNQQPVIIEATAQAEYYGLLMQNAHNLGKPLTLAIGCENSKAGYELGILLSRAFQDHRVQTEPLPLLKWIDLGKPDWEYYNNVPDKTHGMIVIHGLAAFSDGVRRERAKDFLRASENYTNILLVQTDNILEYCGKGLGLELDGVFQVGRPAKTYGMK